MLFEALARMKNGMENQMMKKEVKLRVCVWGEGEVQVEKMLDAWLHNSVVSSAIVQGLQVTFMMVGECSAC